MQICVGDHATHKTLFKKNLDSSNALVCLDGQQRLTTTTIFLMALRAEARQQSRGNFNVKNLVQKIDSKLFTNVKAILGMKRWAKDKALQMVRSKSKNCLSFTMPTLTPGWLPPFETILTPSYIDRAAYFELLCKDYVFEALEQQLQKTSQNNNKIELKFSSTCQESVQHTAFNIFANKLQRFATLATPQGSVQSSLNKLYKRQMADFSIMYVELLTNDNMQQIFLWMQEKSVFGMGKLLANDSPGVDFNHVDLARNLIISSFMNEPLEVQVQFYKSCWIFPLEERFGTEGVRRILEAMVKSISTQKESRHIGDMEKKLTELKAATPILMRDAYSDDKPMMIYSRFHSYVQQRAMEMNKGNLHAISREVAKSIVQEMVVIGESLDNAWS